MKTESLKIFFFITCIAVVLGTSSFFFPLELDSPATLGFSIAAVLAVSTYFFALSRVKLESLSFLEPLTIYTFTALLFFLPLSLEKEILNSGTRLLLFTEPLCAVLSVTSISYLFLNRNKQRNLTIIDKFSIGFILSVLISTILSDNHFVSIKYTISLIWYFSSGYLVVRQFSFTRKQVFIAVAAFALGTALLSLWIIFNYYKLGGIFYEYSYEVSKPFIPEGHTDMSVVIEPVFFMALSTFFMISWNKTKHIIYTLIGFTLFSAVVMFSCSKASYGAVLVCVAAFFHLRFIHRYDRKNILCYVLPISPFKNNSEPRVKVEKNKTPLFTRLKIPVLIASPFIFIALIWQVNDYLHIKEVKQLENSHYQTGGSNYDPTDKTTFKATNMLDELINQSRDTENNDSNLERKNRWLAGIDMYSNNPIFGIGMGTFPDKYLTYLSLLAENIEENYLSENRMNLHNIFLAYLVEGGLVTFIFGIGLIFIPLGWLIKDFSNGKKNEIKLFLIVYLLSFIIHGTSHDFSQNARVIIPFWIVAGLVSRQMLLSESKNKE